VAYRIPLDDGLAATLNISASGGVAGVAKPASYLTRGGALQGEATSTGAIVALVLVILAVVAAGSFAWRSYIQAEDTRRQLAGDWEAKRSSEDSGDTL
tara:strand:- start:506 stop:799 length:294 start_codon:yes stop_codon:yes gene_type:complete